MIPAQKQSPTTMGGVIESISFGISEDDSSHLIGLLVDGIYTDKFLACLREYAANAWDAHRMAGILDRPIEITLPTYAPGGQFLTVRDFGPGMSPHDVKTVLTRVGASMKRDSNEVIGSFGIGAKAGWAYTSSFTFTSYHGGKKRVYVATNTGDMSKKPTLNLILEEDSDETGVEVRIPVRMADIGEFVGRAQKLYRFFEPQPIINTTLDPVPDSSFRSAAGVAFASELDDDGEPVDDTWTAVMGCVPYRLDKSQFPDVQWPLGSGILYFDIGAVQVAASREELRYSDVTRAAIEDKVDQLKTDVLSSAKKAADDPSLLPWQRRMMSLDMQAHFPFAKRWIESAGSMATEIYNTRPVAGEEIHITRESMRTQLSAKFSINRKTFFACSTSTRHYPSYKRNRDCVLLVFPKLRSMEKVRAAALALIAKLGLEGAPLIDAKTMPGTAPQRPARVVSKAVYFKTAKHLRCGREKGFSTDWAAITDLPPSSEGGFVPTALNRWKTDDAWNIAKSIAALKALGLPAPTIVGVKGHAAMLAAQVTEGYISVSALRALATECVTNSSAVQEAASKEAARANCQQVMGERWLDAMGARLDDIPPGPLADIVSYHEDVKKPTPDWIRDIMDLYRGPRTAKKAPTLERYPMIQATAQGWPFPAEICIEYVKLVERAEAQKEQS